MSSFVSAISRVSGAASNISPGEQARSLFYAASLDSHLKESADVDDSMAAVLDCCWGHILSMHFMNSSDFVKLDPISRFRRLCLVPHDGY